MTPDKWDRISPADRAKKIKALDRSMSLPEWKPLLERICSSNYEGLTDIQKHLVKGIQ